MKTSLILPILPLPFVFSSPAANHDARTNAKKYLIIDNDWGITDFTLTNLALLSKEYTLLGATSSTGITWALQSGLHALQSIQLLGGNPPLTSCVPVQKGADYPILNNPGLYTAYQSIFGIVPFAGAFRPQNDTAEALGLSDPTSGDPQRIAPAAFVNGQAPNPRDLAGTDAAYFMIQMVRKYPGQVTIYCAGPMTNIALAVRLDPLFARNTAGLVQMGGYIDTDLYTTVPGDILQADINIDLNFKFDPEAAKIALTADFPRIQLVGNGANGVFLSPADIADITARANNTFTRTLAVAYPLVLPLWDQTALVTLLYPDTIRNSTVFYVDVDVAFASPFYGQVKPYQELLKSTVQTLRNVTYVYAVDEQRVRNLVKDAVVAPPTRCQG